MAMIGTSAIIGMAQWHGHTDIMIGMADGHTGLMQRYAPEHITHPGAILAVVVDEPVMGAGGIAGLALEDDLHQSHHVRQRSLASERALVQLPPLLWVHAAATDRWKDGLIPCIVVVIQN